MTAAADDERTIAAAAAVVRDRLTVDAPEVGIILGSGLGGLVGRIAQSRRLSFADVPGFPAATVAGHAGALVAGTLGGRSALLLAGRFHLYEGHAASVAALPVRLMRALGARTLVVSNAAGGIRRTFRVGDLMLIRDHLNLMWRNPLIGAVMPGDERFPDMSAPYDRELGDRLGRIAAQQGTPLVEGVYAGLLGPAYETPAEVRMLERLGADAVGMSTVPEVIAARAMGMRVVGVSCITNMACGIGAAALSHDEVLETTARVATNFERMIEALVATL